MISLAASMAAEMFVIFWAAADSHIAGTVAAFATLVVIASLWFAWPLSSRRVTRRAQPKLEKS